jgi:methyltransferase (TIGR00027 family)
MESNANCPEEPRPGTLSRSAESTEQQNPIDVTLQGVAETLLIPLAARAFDASTHKPILGDSYAKNVLHKLNYDFDKTTLSPMHCAIMMLRTRHLDRWAASFLAAHPDSTVLHLACGLDSRAQRVEWGAGTCWFDIDLPEVIALRQQVLPQSFPGRDYRLLSANVTEDDWLKEIPTDKSTVVIMEGLLAYLVEEDVKGLLSRLTETLREGELLFECINAAVLAKLRQGQLEAVERTGAEFQWSIEDPKQLQDVHPRLRMLEVTRVSEAPGVEDLPFIARASLYLLSWVPSARDTARFVRYGIGPKES